jgi:hypothetical protein
VAKQSGLGQKFFVGGFDLSGDTGSADNIGGGPAAGDLTGIDKSAFERVGLLRTGSIEWSSWFNPTGAHPVLSAMPYTDVHLAWLTSTTLGDPAAVCIAKQIDYAPERDADGSLAIDLVGMSNGYGLEWGQTLTAGLRTDTTATNGTSIDTTASASFGAQAYLQVTALTGTNVVVTVQDSADNSSFSAVTGLAFTSVTAAPGYERLQLGATATVRRYLRVATSGTFTSASFVVVVVKNQTTTAF